MSKKLIIFAVIVAILLIAYIAVRKGGLGLPSGSSVGGDTTREINSQLGGINVNNIDAEFRSIDRDLNSL